MTGGKRRSTRANLIKRDGIRIIKTDGQILCYGWCYICEVYLPAPDLTIDHVTPIHKGGTNDLSNLELACRDCNQERNQHYKRPVPPPNAPSREIYKALPHK